MKQHDEWWEEYGKHYKIDFFEAITGDAFRAGMLAAADIVTDSARGFRLDREGVANKIREATE